MAEIHQLRPRSKRSQETHETTDSADDYTKRPGSPDPVRVMIYLIPVLIIFFWVPLLWWISSLGGKP